MWYCGQASHCGRLPPCIAKGRKNAARARSHGRIGLAATVLCCFMTTGLFLQKHFNLRYTPTGLSAPLIPVLND
eukprot:1158595-Pelagomonas_calceolata.AAC.5